jgi:hypothetical protein
MMASGIHSAAARPPGIVLPQPRRVQVAVRRAVQTQISWLATLEFPTAHGIPSVGREVSPVSSGREADLSLIAALALADGAGTAVGEATVGVADGADGVGEVLAGAGDSGALVSDGHIGVGAGDSLGILTCITRIGMLRLRTTTTIPITAWIGRIIRRPIVRMQRRLHKARSYRIPQPIG